MTMPGFKRYGWIIVAAFFAAGGLAVVGVLSPSAGTAPTADLPHGATAPLSEIRTVLVSTAGTPAVSIPNQPLHTLLQEGMVPAQPMGATVLSDENCSPDAEGVSHCVNKLRLDSGAVLVLVHPHRMADVPCLSPGEHVTVQRSA